MKGKEERRGVVTRVRALRRDRGGGRGIQRGGRERGGNPSRGARISLSLSLALSSVCVVRRRWSTSGGVRSGERRERSGGGGVGRNLCGARGDFGVGRPDLARAVPLCCDYCCLLPWASEKSENGMEWAEEEGLPFSTGSETQPADSSLPVGCLALSASRTTLSHRTASLGWARAVAAQERVSHRLGRVRLHVQATPAGREGSGEGSHSHSGQGGLVTPRDPCARPRRTCTAAYATHRRVGLWSPWSPTLSHVWAVPRGVLACTGTAAGERDEVVVVVGNVNSI